MVRESLSIELFCIQMQKFSIELDAPAIFGYNSIESHSEKPHLFSTGGVHLEIQRDYYLNTARNHGQLFPISLALRFFCQQNKCLPDKTVRSRMLGIVG